jgi:hypothetical protein
LATGIATTSANKNMVNISSLVHLLLHGYLFKINRNGSVENSEIKAAYVVLTPKFPHTVIFFALRD